MGLSKSLKRKIISALANHGFAIQGLSMRVTVRVEKFKQGSIKPYQILESHHNKFLVEGMEQLKALMIGTNTDYYDNGNARTGVGNDNTAEDEAQTGLIGGSSEYKAMDVTYPNVGTSKTIIFKSTYASAEGNFAWEEYIVDNGAADDDTLLRIVSSKGTKSAGETWSLQITCVLANP